MPVRFRCPVVVAAVCAASGCAPADLGQDPDILWWTDHETGDLSDWTQGGGYWTYKGGELSVVALPNPTRSGKFSLMSSVKSQDVGTQSGAQVLRSSGLPPEAYYSAWYYFPNPIINTNYWAFFQFRSRTDAADSSTVHNWWDLEVMTDSTINGGLPFLSLYQHSISPAQPTRQNYTTESFPIGQWFQVEVYLHSATDISGNLTVWLNGTQIFEVAAQATMPSSYIEWVVGGAAESINPDPGIMFIDDAAVSKRRLGPDFPVFWRGN